MGGATYIWFPEDYLHKDPAQTAKDGTSAVYCSGIKLPKVGGKKNVAILGVNFMKHYDWYFHTMIQGLTFTRSTCDDEMNNKEYVPVLGIEKLKKGVVGQFDVIGQSTVG